LEEKASSSSLSNTLSTKLYNSVVNVDQTWDSTVQPLSLPTGMELLMADVCGGSESPSMARKILAWKKEKGCKGGDDDYWSNLEQVNRDIQHLFATDLSSSSSELQSWMEEQQKTCSKGMNRSNIFTTCTAKEWDAISNNESNVYTLPTANMANILIKMRDLFSVARTNLRCMGEAAGVPVEPKEQMDLADATMKVPGVIAAGVPGAGGYDALFVLYMKGIATGGGDGASSDEVRDTIGELWRNWSVTKDEDPKKGGGVSTVCPLAVRAAGSGGVHGLCETDLGW